jgi:acyl carrier protein
LQAQSTKGGGLSPRGTTPTQTIRPENQVTPDIQHAVRSFIEENFLVGAETQIGDTESLLQLQIVDSTGFLEIVAFIETTFGIKVGDDEMVPENLETIANVVEYVGRKLAPSAEIQHGQISGA